MAKGELNTTSIRIEKLRSKILDGEIKIPPFQRGFVWKQEQVIDLLDSIYNDYPVGSILLWETTEDLPSARNIGGFVLPEVTAEYPRSYILDGQQRVTTIFGVFCEGLPQEAADFIADLNLFEIYFDFDEKKFVHESKLINTHVNLKLRLLFNNFDFNMEIGKYTREQQRLAVELQSLFQNYELPLVTIKKREKEEVGIIFERINNTGTQLSTLDLMVAWTWKEDYHLKEVFDEIYELLEKKSFGDIKQKIILQCFSAIIKGTTATAEILTLNPSEVRDKTELLKNSLEKAIDFICTQYNVKSEDFLPKSHQIVPLTYLFSKTNHLNEEQSSTIGKWFWRTSFSSRYSSATDEAMDNDITFFDSVLANDFSSLERYQSSLPTRFLETQTLTKSNANVRSILLLFSQYKPLDLTNGNNIDLGNALSIYNRKEYHHVFPKAFLKSKGLGTNQINVICNFCFLPANSNKVISNKEPLEYFFNIVPSGKFKEILESNLLPTNEDIYRKNDFSTFIQERSKLIQEAIKQLTGE
ncbi:MULTISPECIES: GmrSD restriction endonuclease domain-containing protein [Bacillus]|uniref:GmrSD restriction endonucleases N-terminal domain-containing protein n=2 Tax=Bacillus cereus TaxID=1396 RepID=Q81H77_BACCR|nr:DUF262 domain-containing protein [Bacillus cereus]AAP07931.1 hypothetical protein BC_0944 [Bacillus cereus ATCC 14579]EEL12941.1 hypothetical protein bcere0015_8080 [Bacillus cereus BDRD-Cer4]ETT82806.1 hypothetical protein C175_10943 [Bacillus cereus]KZD74510.1 hypothetical protein B4155_4999 [Bacillus cereus]MCC3286493.1 DUF262 domain-containing protein [Bacillus cereus]